MKNRWLVIHSLCTLVLAVVAGTGAFLLSDEIAGPSSSPDDTSSIANSVPDSSLPPWKQAFVDNENRLIAEGLKITRAPGQFPLGPPPSPKIEPWPTGIIAHPSVAVRAGVFNIGNGWQGYLDGQIIQVFAGSLIASPQTGIVDVRGFTPEGRIIPSLSGEYKTNLQGSPLTIVGATGYKLLLSFNSGGSPDIVFDLNKRQFETTHGSPLIGS